MPDGGGGSSGSQTVVQNSSPWSGVQAPLTEGYGDLKKIYKQGAPDYYPGNTVAGFSPQQQQSIQGITDLATNGNQTLTAANDQLKKTIQGDYLNAENPYFSQMLSTLRQPVDSTYSMGGRYGSGAHDAAIAGVAGNLSYQNYAQERQNQLNAINQAPGIDQARYYGQQQLGNVGAAVQQQGQNIINADIMKHDYNQNKDINWLSQYLGMLNGASGGSVSTTQPMNGPNPWTQYAGAGLAAGGLLANFLGG
jgi:hypothetical protein